MIGPELLQAIHAVFNGKRARALWFKTRYAILAAFFVLLCTQVKPAWFSPGFYVALFGELIQIWSFASLDKNNMISAKGPYMFVRNPMYIGRFFLVLGCLLVTGYIVAVPVLAVLYYFYAVNRTRREEERLRALFGEAYGNYCRGVNRFVPSLKAFERRSLFFFKWRLLVRNHGLQNLVATLGGFFVLYLFA